MSKVVNKVQNKIVKCDDSSYFVKRKTKINKQKAHKMIEDHVDEHPITRILMINYWNALRYLLYE